jgi:hypothetical protein
MNFSKIQHLGKMFSPYLESVAPAFCAESSEAESVN